jgi:hypothetical protein
MDFLSRSGSKNLTEKELLQKIMGDIPKGGNSSSVSSSDRNHLLHKASIL